MNENTITTALAALLVLFVCWLVNELFIIAFIASCESAVKKQNKGMARNKLRQLETRERLGLMGAGGVEINILRDKLLGVIE